MEKENLDVKECTFKPKISIGNINNSKGAKPQQKQKIVLKHPLKPKNSNSSSKLTSNQPTDRLVTSTLMNSIEGSKQPTDRVALSNEKKAEVM